jgi:hypothetical protein
VLHFLDRFREDPSLPGARPPLSQGTGARSSERRRAAVPRLAPIADDASGVRAEALDHGGWEGADTAEGLDEQPDGQDSEAFAVGREPPGDDTGIIITPVAAVAQFEKDEPGLEAARVQRSQPPIAASPLQPDPKEPEQAHPHLDPAVDTGIVVTPLGFPAREK